MRYPTILCNYSMNQPDSERCGDQATDIILWGCLEQHVMEFTVCGRHMHHWINLYHVGQIQCAYCYGQAASYLTNQIRHLKKGFEIKEL